MLSILHVFHNHALSYLPISWGTHITKINVKVFPFQDEATLLGVLLVILFFALFNVPSKALAAVFLAFDNGRAILRTIYS